MRPDEKQPHVLLIEDHAIIRFGMRCLLEQKIKQPIVFGEAGTAHEALELVSHNHWDAVLLDINLPGRSGLDLICDLRKIKPSLQILVVSMYPENQYALPALKAGAAGYISKNASPEELVHAVTTVLSGRHYVNHAVAQTALHALAQTEDAAAHHQLSARELEVLRLLGKGQRISDIAATLNLSIKTVSTHRAHILQKLRLHTTGELVKYAIEHHIV